MKLDQQFPQLASELRELLHALGEAELASQIAGEIVERCRARGMLILDGVSEVIANVEVLDRKDVREKLRVLLPERAAEGSDLCPYSRIGTPVARGPLSVSSSWVMRAAVFTLGFTLACARTPLMAESDGSVGETAGCLYLACDGVRSCPLGEGCPAGDSLPNDAGGGNLCFCTDASGAPHVEGSALGFTCSANAAACR